MGERVVALQPGVPHPIARVLEAVTDNVVNLRLATGLLGLALIAWPTVGAPQVQTSSEERFFRIDWQIQRTARGAPAIAGTVRNDYVYPVQRVQLHVVVLDSAGQVIHETFALTSDIPPGGRGDFRLPLPVTGARYIVLAPKTP